MPRIDIEKWEEIKAAAMLLGEPPPILCSLCIGAGQTKSIISFRRCIQCYGTGFDYIGPGTSRYAGVEQPVTSQSLDRITKHVPYEMKAHSIESMLLHWHEDNQFVGNNKIADRIATWVVVWVVCVTFWVGLWRAFND